MHRRSFLTRSALGTALAAAHVTLPGLARAGGHGRLGTFTGNARYGISGTAELTDGGVNLLDDFRFGSAPDPKVALGRDGYDPATLMGPLKNASGASSYALPAGIDANRYNEVYIWCERFNVPLAVARLN